MTTKPQWRQDRFFAVMATIIALTVFAGFSRTYFLKQVFGTKPLTPFFHLHGAVFSCWIILFVVQVALVRAGRTDLHRKLGVTAVVLAPIMVVIGVMAAIDSARRGFTPPGGPPPLVFFIIPLADLFVFSCLVAAGLWLRRQPADHKRLMLLAAISILTPAIARLPGVAAAGPPAFLGLTDLFIVICMLSDKLVHGRVHRAFLWGGIFIIASQPLRFAIASTDVWLTFARWAIR
ncbi:MAG: hypothetical protein QOI24_4432 [Acidobacteriota bacterium]|jgi:hypothetical protein|nr:hypothetical protein [Acidobacteriota bacterium]